jgi:hypothetical protein
MSSLEKSIEELIQRVVDSTLASVRAGLAPLAAAPTGSLDRSIHRVSQAVASVLQPSGQTEIMAAALSGAAGLAGRCVLFVRRGDQFSVWRAEGLYVQASGALRSISVSAVQPGIFQELCAAQQPICRQPSPGTLPAALEQALGSTAGGPICLLPVVVQGKVVAALFSDAGSSASSEAMAALEILARVTGLSLETAASRAAAVKAGAAGTASTAGAAAPERVQETGESVGLETPTPQLVEEPVPSRGSFAADFPAEGLSLLPPLPDVEALPDEDRESHRKAHRFARVAVQDLISYHKDKIERGRRDKSLFDLLEEDIKKTRENYQRRFGQTAARTFDYLHYEMVAKLAGNDPSLLGDHYPGPQAREESVVERTVELGEP